MTSGLVAKYSSCMKALLGARIPQPILAGARFYSANVVKPGMPGYEDHVRTLLKSLDPVEMSVTDISGGCGSMFAISIASEKFRDMPMVKRHRLVNQVLQGEISQWHGLQLKTLVPPKSEP